MPRTPLLLVVATGVLALAGAWLAVRDEPSGALPGVASTADPSGDAGQRTPRQSRVPIDVEPPAPEPSARPRPLKPPGRLFVHVVRAEDDSPIAGARVELPDGEAEWATTDEQGELQIDVPLHSERLELKDHWLDVTAPGRVRGSVNAVVASGADSSETVSLRRAFAVDGFVQDSTGQPVARPRVSASGSGWHGPGPEIASSTGDDEGRFRIDGLPIDNHLVFWIGGPGHTSTSILRRPHDTTPFDVTLEPAGVMRGIVLTPDGRPVAGARVWPLRSRDGRDGFDLMDAEVLTGNDGRFVFDWLEFGPTWKLHAEHADFMRSEDSETLSFAADRTEATCELHVRPLAHVDVSLGFSVEHEPSIARLVFAGGSKDCAIPGRTTVTVDSPGRSYVYAYAPGLRRGEVLLDLDPGERTAVRIDFDEGAGLGGFVVDDLGAAIAGAVVQVDRGIPLTQEAKTGATGSFLVKGLAEGPHQVNVKADGHAELEIEGLGAPKTDARFVLARHGEVALRLRVPEGHTLPAKWSVGWQGDSVWGGAEGAWGNGDIVCSLPSRSERLCVVVEGFVTWGWTPVEVASGRRTDVGDVLLDPGLTLFGRVVDPSGSGVPHQAVEVDDDQFETDANGLFSAPHRSAGSHQVLVRFSADYLDARVRVDLRAESPPVVVKLQRGAVLRVSLLGDSAALADLEVRSDPPGLEANVLDDSESLSREQPGRYSARLPAGPRRVEVWRDDLVSASKDADLGEGDDLTVEIELPK